MFTFGREHEKKCALWYLHNASEANLIHQVVDAIHDLLEGTTTAEAICPILAHAFAEGGGGVWEQTGKWMSRLSVKHAAVELLWRALAQHKHAKVRFRVACFIDEVASPLARELGAQLKSDRSQKVREMALARLDELADDQGHG